MSEHDEQSAVVGWLSIHHPDVLFWATPNGAHLAGSAGRRAASMNKLKAEGFLPGVSDLIIFEKRGQYSAMFLEMKRTDGGVASENQLWFLREVEKRGAYGVVANGYEEAVDFLTWYLSGAEAK